MFLKKIDGPRAVKMADGSIMTRADLPPTNTRRWVASRKAAVTRAIKCGLITEREALTKWGLCQDELNEWLYAVDKFGEVALKTTKLQQYRQP